MTAGAIATGDPAAPVRLEEWPAGPHRIGVATLNNEKTLNSLSQAMIDVLAPALDRWQADPGVVAIWLSGAGERAFAAGGDIQALHHAIRRNREAGRIVDDYAERFFADEYRLDYRLHTYPKPVLAWGHGVIMGGGLGLLSASSHRVVTENARIAMPEVTIGLYPDAGGTWFLRGLAPEWAAWLGLSGAHMNQADAMVTGLATHTIDRARRDDVIAALRASAWTGDAGKDGLTLSAVLDAFVTRPDVAASPLSAHRAVLADALLPLPANAAQALERLGRLPSDDAYLAKGVDAARRGSAVTLGIVLEQLRRAPALDLAGCFRMEMVVSAHCARHGEFVEGVRALLVDKDNAPRWTYPDARDMPDDWVAGHFVPPWPVNPLHDLGEGRRG